jgi:hypothetical protein
MSMSNNYDPFDYAQDQFFLRGVFKNTLPIIRWTCAYRSKIRSILRWSKTVSAYLEKSKKNFRKIKFPFLLHAHFVRFSASGSCCCRRPQWGSYSVSQVRSTGENKKSPNWRQEQRWIKGAWKGFIYGEKMTKKRTKWPGFEEKSFKKRENDTFLTKKNTK